VRRQVGFRSVPGRTNHGRMITRHIEFASAILIDQRGRFLFQQRDNVPGIRHPGMIGLFGGHREPGETFAECVSREVHEEIGYLVPPDRFERLAEHSGADVYGTNRGEFFVAYDIPADALNVTEGALVIVESADLPDLMPRLAPSARTAVQTFMGRGG